MDVFNGVLPCVGEVFDKASPNVWAIIAVAIAVPFPLAVSIVVATFAALLAAFIRVAGNLFVMHFAGIAVPLPGW